jgi:hypothetical protein
VYPELAATSFEDDELRVAMQSRQLIIQRRITDSSGDGEAVARVAWGWMNNRPRT